MTASGRLAVTSAILSAQEGVADEMAENFAFHATPAKTISNVPVDFFQAGRAFKTTASATMDYRPRAQCQLLLKRPDDSYHERPNDQPNPWVVSHRFPTNILV